MTERLKGKSLHKIEYRHVIRTLVRKPGAFGNYRYKDDLFPTQNFRRAYDALLRGVSERTANIDYVRILKHAADTMQEEVDLALVLLLESNEIPRWSRVIELIPEKKCDIPIIQMPPVDLKEYDTLLSGSLE